MRIVVALTVLLTIFPCMGFTQGQEDGAPRDFFDSNDGDFVGNGYNKVVAIYLTFSDPHEMYLRISDETCKLAEFLVSHAGYNKLMGLSREAGLQQKTIVMNYEESVYFLDTHEKRFLDHGMNEDSISRLKEMMWLYWGNNPEGLQHVVPSADADAKTMEEISCLSETDRENVRGQPFWMSVRKSTSHLLFWGGTTLQVVDMVGVGWALTALFPGDATETAFPSVTYGQLAINTSARVYPR